MKLINLKKNIVEEDLGVEFMTQDIPHIIDQEDMLKAITDVITEDQIGIGIVDTKAINN